MKDGSESRFIKALHLQKSGCHQMALEAYEAILREDPTHTGSLINSGIIYYLRSQWDRASECFQEALKVDQSNPHALYNYGKLLLESRNPTEALPYLQRALDLTPNDVMTLRELSVCYLELGQTDNLIATLARGLELAPGNPDLLILKARAFVKSGDFAGAIATLNNVLKQNPASEEVLILLAETYFHSQALDKAILTIKRALLSNPDSAEGYKRLGIYYMLRGDEELARAQFTRAKELDPSVVSNLPTEGRGESEAGWDAVRFQNYVLERSRFYAKSGNSRGAINEFLLLAHRYPTRGIIWQELAAAYQSAGEAKRAFGIYQKVLEIDPKNLEVRLQLTRIAMALGKLEEASKLNAVSLSFYPNVSEVVQLAAEICLKGEDPAKALALFDRALELDATNIEALIGKGHCYMAQGLLADARSIWEKTYRIAPSNLNLCLSLVDIYQRLGQARKALEVLVGAKKFFASNLQVRGRLASLYLETKSFRQAKTELKEVLSLTSASVDDIPFFLPALTYARRVKDALRLVKRYATARGETPDGLFFETLLYTFKHDDLRFPIPWQKLLKTCPSILDERFEYLRLVLSPSDITFLSRQIKSSLGLYVTFPDTQRHLSAFDERLRSIPGGGHTQAPARLVVEES
ncbi:MAG: tetratricopeptide repeat protein [Candidatus Riflebacteria bacterium]|nr:tetratricopeptide repeat protein [Candidatus Riflebacteria bacterium]